jgi:hypothetical protein
LDGSETRLQPFTSVGGHRAAHALVSVDADDAMAVGLTPLAHRLLLDLQTETLLGLAVGRDTEISDEFHAGDARSANTSLSTDVKALRMVVNRQRLT